MHRTTYGRLKDGQVVDAYTMRNGHGVAVQVNAFNFPVWGFLEKLAPTFLAGVPTVVKPASQTAYVTEAVVRSIVESGLLPEGSVQLLAGSAAGVSVLVSASAWALASALVPPSASSAKSSSRWV